METTTQKIATTFSKDHTKIAWDAVDR